MLGLGLGSAAISYLAHQGSIALPLLSMRARGRSSAGVDAVDRRRRGCSFRACAGPAHIERQSAGNIEGQRRTWDSAKAEEHDRMRSALVITEVALACVLLVGAGLLLRSFLRVLDVDLGFEPTPRSRHQRGL